MTEKETTKIEPLSEEEILGIAKRLEDADDLNSELSRAIFTILVVGYEYQNLYSTLQAYYAAASGACHDVAAACAQTIGLRDTKKIMKMYKIAAHQAGNIPARAQALLTENTTEGEENKDEESTK